MHYLEFDWPINYTTTTSPQPVCTNHPYATHVCQFIATEVSLQATAGPFEANPFHCSLMLSLLLTIPKRNSTPHQIVMDLSFPVGCSVNDSIPKDTFLGEPFQLCLPGVETLVTLNRCCGPNCLISKKDLGRAYRQFPIDPRDYHYLKYSFDNLLFFNTVFTFGLSPLF